MHSCRREDPLGAVFDVFYLRWLVVIVGVLRNA